MTMILPNGHVMTTTFNSDFAIADLFGVSGVQDTYNRAFEEWRSHATYIAEMVVILNHRGWFHYNEGRQPLAKLYFQLYQELLDWGWDNYQGDDLTTYYNIVD